MIIQLVKLIKYILNNMHYFDSTTIDGDIFLHQVGNKLNDEPLVLSSQPLDIDDDITESLKEYFLSHFKQTEYYRFDHETSLAMNEVFNYVSAIFDNIAVIGEQSKNLAKTLYRMCTHPNIKCGEFYVVHFKNCLIEGVMTDAIGLFKSENKESFLKVSRGDHKFELIRESGININKLDKGCLVFNVQRENGYVISVVDNSKKKGEAKYWIEDFLQVKPKNDEYEQTRNIVSMCKEFISQLPQEMPKVQKANMMNCIMNHVKSGVINVEQLATAAFGKKIADGDFSQFKKEYQETNDISFSTTFNSKKEVLSNRLANSITTLKLDNNFDVKIHGGEKLIERGYDEKRGMSYYKLYFDGER